jgi:sugar lactone lactonase YvrE
MMRAMFVVAMVAVVLSFDKPAQAASDELWAAWVVNPGNTNLGQRFDQQGNQVGSNLYATGGGPPNFGVQLMHDGTVHVANVNTTVGVRRFDALTGVELSSYNTIGGASDIGSDAAGNLYVIDQSANVYKGNMDGTGLVSIASGSGNTNGLAVDPSGTLYVSNSGNLIRKYDSSGSLLATFTGNSLNAPVGVAIGPDGKIYVANDSGTGSISRFLADGTADGNFASSVGKLWDLDFDSGGTLYAGNSFGGGGVEMFDSSMTSLGLFPHANFSSNGNNAIYGLTIVPEPSMAGLIGLGALLVLKRRRTA